MKRVDIGLLFQSMSLPSDETVGTYMGIRGEGSLVSKRLNSERSTRSSVVVTRDSSGGLSFALAEYSDNSTRYVESSKSFPWRLVT